MEIPKDFKDNPMVLKLNDLILDIKACRGEKRLVDQVLDRDKRLTAILFIHQAINLKPLPALMVGITVEALSKQKINNTMDMMQILYDSTMPVNELSIYAHKLAMAEKVLENGETINIKINEDGSCEKIPLQEILDKDKRRQNG